MSDDTALMQAARLPASYRARKLSPVESMRAVFDRIERFNPVPNGFFRLDKERPPVSG